MKELHEMVSELRARLNNKAENLENRNSHIEGKLKNRKEEIDSFEKWIDQVKPSPFEKQEVIRNFKQKAEEIAKYIDEIG